MSLLDWLNPVTNPILNPVNAIGSTGAQVKNVVTGAGDTRNNATGVVSVGSPFGSFTTWLPYFLLLGGALLIVNQSDKYAPLGTAFAVLIVSAYAFSHWNGIVKGYNDTFGTQLPGSVTTPPA